MTPVATSQYFLALVLPEPLRTQVTAIKQEFAKRYHSRHALRSPPHVTLFPPFRWPTAEVDAFESLRDFCGGHAPVPLRLNGFGCFAPRVIFVRPEKTDALLDLQRGLQAHLGTQLDLVDPMAGKRRFSPHVTVAFRDLSVENFRRAWLTFRDRPLDAQCTVSELTLLRHDASAWVPERAWPFGLTG